MPLVLLAGLAGTLAYVYAHTTIPEAPPGPQTTFVYDRDGRVIARLHAEVDRTLVPLDAIPLHLRQAVIAAEDKDFYEHGGISPLAILRAAWTDLTRGRLEQGGSTITQQYVKNVYTGSERSFGRKVREAILALKLERQLSKDEILARYLNTVYFGNGAYGVEAAARTYFGVPARRLTVLQSATLAGLIPAPEAFDPVTHPERARERRNLVLRRMAEEGYLTPAQAEELGREPLRVRARRPPEFGRYGYFVDVVVRRLLDRYGYGQTFTGGLRVRTTLDVDWQRAAEEAVARYLGPGDPEAALVAVDPRDGAVRALVGGRDFRRDKFNLATQAHRQTGSAFKPFTLAVALEEGISLQSVWSGPPTLVVDDPRCAGPGGEPWEVSSYADASYGTMSLLDATAYSVNTIYAQLVTVVGPERVVEVAHRMGIESPLQPVCSITLGSQPVTPLEMTAAYATLAARGTFHPPLTVERVASAHGDVLERARPRGRPALEPNVADLVTLALQRVIEAGTGTNADLGRPAAGKTGTAQDYADAWFCGYVPQLAACVWVGHREGRVPMHDVAGFANVTGGSVPALIWRDFMLRVLEGVSVQPFPQPSLEGLDRFPEGAVPPTMPSPSPTPTPSPSPTPPSPSPTPPSPTPTPIPTPTLPPTTPPTTPPPPTPTSSPTG